MHSKDENDGTLVINAQELQMAHDCEPIVRSMDVCGYAWPPVTNLAGDARTAEEIGATVRLTALFTAIWARGTTVDATGCFRSLRK
jgi:hypothetical protein